MTAVSPKIVKPQMLFIGDPGVGKSFYSCRIRNHAVPDVAPSATIYVEYHILSNAVPEKNGSVEFSLIDVGGTRQFQHLLPNMYRKASVVVMFYDLTRRATFDSLRTNWWPSVQTHAGAAKIVILIGNKADAGSARQVTREEAQQFAAAAKLDGCYEVSAMCDEFDNVYRPIQMCALLALERLPAAPPTPPSRRALSIPTASQQKADSSCCGSA
jgi:small GTP-binding protein